MAVLCVVTQLYPTLYDPVNCSPLVSSVHGDSPGKNTGLGCTAPLQGIFPTQELNQGLLHCRWILYQQSYLGEPLHGYFCTIDITLKTDTKTLRIRFQHEYNRVLECVWRVLDPSGCYHRLNGHEFEQTQEDSEGQGSLAC